MPLTPRVFDLLLLLVTSDGRLLTKDEIFEGVWPDTVVEESNLTQNIFVLRKALGESSQNPQFIRTVPTKGYRFIAPVSVLAEPVDPGSDASTLSEDESPIAVAEPETDVRASPNGVIWIAAAVCGLILVTLGLAGGRYFRTAAKRPVDITYQQLTFERGTVWTGRFLPKSNAVIYNANFNNRGLEIYSLQFVSPESHPMGIPNTNLLSISSRGEMAILRNPSYVYQFIQRGTLAVLPVNGAGPRDITENVQEADWDPAGDQLAIVRAIDSGNRLEYPVGNAIAESTGYLSCPRFAPSGDKIAVFRHPYAKDNRGTVSILDTSGKELAKTDDWAGLEGLAWHGDEVWFTASRSGETYALYALAQDGTVRTVERSVSNLLLSDVAPDGSVLLSRATQLTDVYLNRAGQSDSDISWLQLIGVADIASDGSSFLFTHFGEGSGKNYAVYLRKTDGSPAVKLGPGRALGLSPDGRWAVAKISDPEGLTLLPTGAGDARTVPITDLEHVTAAEFCPDGKKLLFTANESGKPRRTFVVDLDGTGVPRPLTPEGVYGTLLSPDAEHLLVTDTQGDRSLFSVRDQKIVQIPGIDRAEDVIRWAADPNSVYVFRPFDLPIKIYRLDVRNGRREMVKQIQPASAAGVFGNIYMFTTADAKTTIYGLRRYLIDLYLAKGLE